MHPYPQPPVPPDLHPLSRADLEPSRDLHNSPLPPPIERPSESASQWQTRPVYSIVPRTPPDPDDLYRHHLLGQPPPPPSSQPHTLYHPDDSAEVEAAIINAGIPSTDLARIYWGQPATRPLPSVELPAPPPAHPPNTLSIHAATESQGFVQPFIPPPPHDIGMSGRTVSALPSPPLPSPPGASEPPTFQRAWPHPLTSSSSSALGLQPAPLTSLGISDSPNPTPLPPPVQPPYARLSERDPEAVEREIAALRAPQSYIHAGQSDQPQQGNAWEINQTPAQLGQLPQHPGQPLPPTDHSLAVINTPNTPPTSRMHMDPTIDSLRPAVFSSPSPESDPAASDALPPPPPTTISNDTSRNPSRHVTGDSASTEVPITNDFIAGRKRTADEAFAGDAAPELSGSEDVGYDEEDVEMLDELLEEGESGVGEEAGNSHVSVFTQKDGQPSSPKRRKLKDASNTQNPSHGMNIRLPPPPSLAGTSRPPAAPTPGMILSRLDVDTAVLLPPAAPTDATQASMNLPPPVPMFQRDPDAPLSYADWVRENHPDTEIERWMECTRRNLVYDPSAVPAPPEGFESGKDRRKEGTGGEKEGDGEEEGEEEGEGEGGAEEKKGKEVGGNGVAGGSGTGKPYEINEHTPPNIHEGLWCLFDYPKNTKPKYSYAFMARVAILGSPTRRLQLQDIYVMIEAKFPFYRDGNHVSWKNSIRHNLSTNKWFVKCERDMVHEPGYSAMWTVDTTSKGGPKKKRERLGRSKKGRAVLAAREAAGKGIIPDPRIVALAIAMKTAPPLVPPGIPITGSAIPPPKLPPIYAEKAPAKKKTPTPVPVALAPTPAPAPPGATPSSNSTLTADATPCSSGGTMERDAPMEVDAAEHGRSNSPPAPIVTVMTNAPTSPLATIEIESVGSASHPPPKKGRAKTRGMRKKSTMLDPPLTSTPLPFASASRRSFTPPKVPTPPFVTLPLPPPAPSASPQSHSQKSKSPPVFPQLNIFMQTKGPQGPQPQPQPPVPAPQNQLSAQATSQPATQPVAPAELSTLGPSTFAPSKTEKEKEKERAGRKEFDQQLLQRLVEDKENPEKARENKAGVHRLFAIPAASTAASPPTVTPRPTLLKPSTSFGSAGVGASFGGFGLTKAASFGFGVSATADATPTPVPAVGGFGAFGSRAGSGSGTGFASFGTTAAGSTPTASKLGFAPFSNQASTSSIKTSNVRGEDDCDNKSQDSDTDMGDDRGVDMDGDIDDEDLGTRARNTTKRYKASTGPQPHTQAPGQTQESDPVVPQLPVTTLEPIPPHRQANIVPNNALRTQPTPPGPAHSTPTATLPPTQTMVAPLSPPASPIQGPTTNALPPTSLFHLVARPRRREVPPSSSSGASPPSDSTKLIKQIIRKHVTLDPTTLAPSAVDLEQMVGDLHAMRLVVHHNFLPRAPLNEDYRRALDNLLKKRRRKRGEPRVVYQGAGDCDFGQVTESEDSGTEMGPH